MKEPAPGAVVGKARIFRGRQLEQLCENGGELCAGELPVGGKRAVAALNDTMLAPAPDGAFGPVPRGVTVDRPRRACA